MERVTVAGLESIMCCSVEGAQSRQRFQVDDWLTGHHCSTQRSATRVRCGRTKDQRNVMRDGTTKTLSTTSKIFSSTLLTLSSKWCESTR